MQLQIHSLVFFNLYNCQLLTHFRFCSYHSTILLYFLQKLITFADVNVSKNLDLILQYFFSLLIKMQRVICNCCSFLQYIDNPPHGEEMKGKRLVYTLTYSLTFDLKFPLIVIINIMRSFMV